MDSVHAFDVVEVELKTCKSLFLKECYHHLLTVVSLKLHMSDDFGCFFFSIFQLAMGIKGAQYIHSKPFRNF